MSNGFSSQASQDNLTNSDRFRLHCPEPSNRKENILSSEYKVERSERKRSNRIGFRIPNQQTFTWAIEQKEIHGHTERKTNVLRFLKNVDNH